MKKVLLCLFTLLFGLGAFSVIALAQDSDFFIQIERLTFAAMKFANTDYKVPFSSAISQAVQRRDITQAEYQELLQYSHVKESKYLQVARHLAAKAEKESHHLRAPEESITAKLLFAKTYIEIARVFPTPPEPFVRGTVWSAPAQAVRLLEEASELLGFYQSGGAPRYTIALFNFHIALGFDELRSLNLPRRALRAGEITYSQRENYHAAKDHLESAVEIASGTTLIRQHEFYRLILVAFKEGGADAFRPPIIEWGTIRDRETGSIDPQNEWNQRMHWIYDEAKRKARKSGLDSKTYRIAKILLKAFTPKWVSIGISIFQEL